ncbi:MULTISPECIES: cytochrome P450 [Streptomyces]|uniref:Cytochrome P450 n=1 Tax=Streptomyces sp. R28 TaxID=3238628 RepID=A0AB39QBJ4_9ACTN
MDVSTSLPRMPGALPVLGHAVQFMRDPAAFLCAASGHGPVVEVLLGPQRTALVCDPELTRQVLVHDKVFDKGGVLYDRLREVTGNGLLSCPFGDHRRQRRLLQPAFHKSTIPLLADVVAEHVRDVVESWRDGQSIDVPAQMRTISARAIVATMFDGSLPGRLTELALADMTTITAGIYRQALMPRALRGLPLFGNHRYAQARQRLRWTLGEVIARRRVAGDGEVSLLSLLLAEDAANGGGPAGERSLSDSEVSDQVLTFFTAGMETTGNLLVWAMHLLARHQDVQRRLWQEVSEVTGGGPTAFEHLVSLKFTRAMMRETLRLYPLAWLLTRTATTDVRLGEHDVLAGTTVAFSPYLVQRLDAVHPRPDQFNPDRWADDRAPQVPLGGFIPFGLGARKCIGEGLAMAEVTLVLAAVVARWHVEPETDRPVRFAKDIVIRPHELRLRVTRRSPGMP